MTYFCCPVCNKRWGDEIEGAEMQFERCDKHKGRLTTAEIYARGLTVGKYIEMKLRHAQGRSRIGRPRKVLVH